MRRCEVCFAPLPEWAEAYLWPCAHGGLTVCADCFDALVSGLSRPELAQRKKPLGTVHAVLCARDVIRTPFAVINADDFYGRGALDAIAAALPQLGGAQDAAMVGYRLKNTVSPFGTVTRGVCATQDGLLRKVQETYKIRPVSYTHLTLPTT